VVTDRVSPFVDYDRVAHRFARWRAGSPDLTTSWGQAVQPFLPDRTLTVGDIGAGTGVFTRAWATWADVRFVIGVDPSAKMLAEASSDRGVESVRYLRGRAESLPLADASLDVAWISTAFHHFADSSQAVSELRRVIVDNGVVLLRGLLRDRIPRGSWFSVFPGHERALQRFPTLGDLQDGFRRAGFELAETRQVKEGQSSHAQQADWVKAMRDADSILTALNDIEIETGLENLRRRPSKVFCHELTLALFR
jgi:SAM-dependent methyltransferase